MGTALNAKLMEFASVKDYGAVGDGVTDDTAAFQAAIDLCGDIFVPTGIYNITSPLDFTDNNEGGKRLHGGSHAHDDSEGSIILGNTGGVVIDCVGSQFLTFENLTIRSGATTPSTCGFLFGRKMTDAGTGNAMMNKLLSVEIDIATDPTAYTNLGGVGVYNYGAELFHMQDCYVNADTPVAIVHENVWAIDSTYTDLTEATTSASQMRLDNVVLWKWTSGFTCLYLSGCWDSVFENIYCGTLVDGGPAITLRGGSKNVEITGCSVEDAANVAMIGNGVTDCVIRAKKAVESSVPFIRTTDESPDYVGLINVTLEVINWNTTPTAASFYNGASGDVISGCTFIANYTPTAWSSVAASNISNCRYVVDGVETLAGRTAAPTGTTNYRMGQVIWNSAPAAAGYMGWVCVNHKDTTASAFSTAAVACTFDDATEVVQKVGHGLSHGDTLSFASLTNISGDIVADTAYYVDNPVPSADTFKVEATVGGSAINITEGGLEGSGVYRLTKLTVAATTSMLAGDIIGITLDDGTIHWTTIATVVDGTTLRYNKPIAAARSVAANAVVYTYRFKGFGAIEA